MNYGDVFWTNQYGYIDIRTKLKDLVKCEYRRTPVPGSGGWSRRYSVLRRMRTTQERRESLAYPEYTRGKRNNANLPEHWDDYARSNHSNKSWKAKKVRKQWMRHAKSVGQKLHGTVNISVVALLNDVTSIE
jgi:hypothetical protein